MKDTEIIALIGKIRLTRAKNIRLIYDLTKNLRWLYLSLLALSVMMLINNQLNYALVCLITSLAFYASPIITKRRLIRITKTIERNQKLFSWEYATEHSDYKTLKKVRLILSFLYPLATIILVVLNLFKQRLL